MHFQYSLDIPQARALNPHLSGQFEFAAAVEVAKQR
jgi:hypothetical protein